MTCEEFSNGFDVLLASYKHQSEFGKQSSFVDLVLDEYEKSIFLTQAQDIIVKSYFEKGLNSNGEGFDDSTRRQIDFSTLITVSTITEISNDEDTFSENGCTVDISDLNALFIINEKVIISNGTYEDGVLTPPTGETFIKKERVVVPINYKEYDRMLSKAYSEPLKRQAWRLIGGTNDQNFELIKRSEDLPIVAYKIRYIRRPTPIVLVDLTSTSNNLMIDGVSEQTECILPSILHNEILQEAVRLALMHNNIETPEVRAAKQNNN